MKNFRMDNPCQVNLDKMGATDNGVYCDKCAVDVYDFRNKTNSEIRAILIQQQENKMCGRFEASQIESLNYDFDKWKLNSKRSMQRAMIFSLVVVFGLTLFSCSYQKEEVALNQFRTSIGKVLDSDLEIKNDSPALPEIEYKLDVKMDDVLEIAREVEAVKDFEELKAVEDVILREEMHYQLDGGIGWSDEYIEHMHDYIEIIEHDLTEIELDANGLEFPKEYNAIAFPNPARESSTLKLELPADQISVTINLFSMSGSLISNVYSNEIKRGTHEFRLSLIDQQPGVYLVTIVSENFKGTVRIIKN